MGKGFVSIKKTTLLICLLVSFFTILASFEPDSIIKIRVKVDTAKIRYEPSANSAVIGSAKRGDIFEPEKKEGDWYLITLPAEETGFAISGYIHQGEIEIISEKSERKEEKPQQEPILKKEQEKVSIEEPPKQEVQEKMLASSNKYRESGKIIYTTADLKYDYEIIGVATHYQEFGTFSLRDPLVGAIKKGMEEFEKKVKEMGGDAVVGLRYEFANRTEKDEGRLLIYGTVVKLK